MTLEFRRISGLVSYFIEYAPPNSLPYSNGFPAAKEKVIDIELANLVSKKLLKSVHMKSWGYISPAFVQPKKDGNYRSTLRSLMRICQISISKWKH